MASNLTNKIDHVVVVMMENRGFDTVLGYLYSQEDQPDQQIPPPQPSHHAPPFFGLDFVDTTKLTNTGTHKGTPISQDPVPVVRATNSTGWDPGEEFEHVNAQLFDIDPTNDPASGLPVKMTGFVRDYSIQCSGDVDAVKQIMHMYTPADLPVLSGLARGYAVSDLWFASVPTQTNANRAFSLCGTSNGLVDNGFLTTGRVDAKLANDRFEVPTLWNVLHDNGNEDWAIFWEDVYPPIGGDNKPYTENLFPRLSGMSGVDAHFHKMVDFHSMAQTGSLPAFSYIEPSWGGYALGVSVMGNEYHPPSDVTPGEQFLAQIYASLQSNTAAWNKTLFLIMFDEHGGTYDHVAPPAAVPPWGATEPTLPKGKQYGFNFDRFGVRVPAIAVSPLIEPKTVMRSSEPTPFDHTSMIATVLEWMLPTVEREAWGLGERVNNAPTFDQVVTRSEPRNDNVLAPQPPSSDVVEYGQPVYLQLNGGSQFISKAYTGELSYYPTLSSGPAQELDFRFGFGPVQDGDTVQIRTSEYLEPFALKGPPGIFVGIRNMLGAWKDQNCYYYSSDDAADYKQEYWTIKRVGHSGGPILNGDQVQLLNPYWNNQNLCADGQYLTTKAGSTDIWTVRQANASAPPPDAAPGLAWTINSNGEVWTLGKGGGAGLAPAGAAAEISVGSDGLAWIVTTQLQPGQAGNIVQWYQQSSKTWVPVPSPAAATKVAVAADGTVWTINSKGEVWTVAQQGGGNRMGAPATATEISLGADGTAWIISTDAQPGQDGNIVKWFDSTSQSWIAVPAPAAAVKVAGAPDGTAWTINSKGEVWTVAKQGGGNRMGALATATEISLGADGTAWIISTDAQPGQAGNIVKWFDAVNSAWVAIPSPAAATKIAAAT